ncbi:MAG TPA: hypothetical protein VHL11_18250, partial [Phototrophicaceae bacterium]|nr:hypothetical protein [Phototrophicaceae bacterium]
AEDVLLAQVLDDKVTLAAPSWKQAVLIWLYQTGEPFALRLHTETEAEPDMTLVNYTFTSPETLPDDYVFDLLIGLPDSKGYQLVDLPASIDHIQYTQSDTRMQFWFTNLELISVENGTEVTIRLPKADADNLDFLLKLDDHSLTFLPDADTYK